MKRIAASRVFVADDDNMPLVNLAGADAPRQTWGRPTAYSDVGYDGPVEVDLDGSWYLARFERQFDLPEPDNHIPDYWWVIQRDPFRTNSSHEPKLRGWLGTTSNISAKAYGRVRFAGALMGVSGSTHCPTKTAEPR